MKWIGQHIFDLVSRLRNDVYLEDVDAGTIATGSTLGLDSSNKIVKYTKVDDKNFVHDQGSAASSWAVTHNLNKFPSVTVVDTAGSVVVGQVAYNSANQVTLTFRSSFAGKAYFN